MQQLKNRMTVALVLLLLLIFVFLRTTNPKVFKEPVKAAIDGTRKNCNLITPDRLQKIAASSLLIDLGSLARHDSLRFQHTIAVPLEHLLDKANLTILKETEGSLVLFADDMATASKAWVILNQLGFKNLFVLTLEENPEAFKYQFQPDTTARLEQVPIE